MLAISLRTVFGLLLLLFWQCEETVISEKINGISLVATGDSLSRNQVKPVVAMHANYIAIMPFGFIKETATPEIVFNRNRQWYGETSEGVAQYIQLLHEHGFEVMMKPQLWIGHGNYTGHMKMPSEAAWKELEASYRDFILEFATVAETSNVAMLCIGTELDQFIQERPEYWNRLIEEIKTVFSGKLTYAANWDEYSRVPFWDQMDFIGVDAYFPVSEEEIPSLSVARAGWQPWKSALQAFSETSKRPILFTEYGYRDITYAGKEPWASHREGVTVNADAQVTLLTSLYEELWLEPWFAGGFLWKWHPTHHRVERWTEGQFSPQKKPAEDVIRSYYKEF